jgi:nucleotide-binding universal stress UspA family protein
MSRRILVPVDGSPKSTAGLEYALSTYGEEDVTVLHVMSPHDVWDEAGADEAEEEGEDEPDEWRERARERADEILADAREAAEAHGVSVSTTVEVGEPWRTIVDYASEEGFDHVIMGSHGRHDDSPLPLGSVAETVMRRSPVLVSIVR